GLRPPGEHDLAGRAPRRPGPPRRRHPRLRKEEGPRQRPPAGRIPRCPRRVPDRPRPRRRLRRLDERHRRPREPRPRPTRAAGTLRRPHGQPRHWRRYPRSCLRPRGHPVCNATVVGPDLLRPRPRLRPRRRLEEVDRRGPPGNLRSPKPRTRHLHPASPSRVARHRGRSPRRERERRRPHPRRPRRGPVHRRRNARLGAPGTRPRRGTPARGQPRSRGRHLPLEGRAGAEAAGGRGFRRQGGPRRRLLQRRGRGDRAALRDAPARLQEPRQLRRLVERVGRQGGPAHGV
ncbi:MAG: Thiosulfate sulfurtransferase, rhodanese, partial [uncultured Rubrobacteraceae bacterium]